MKQLPINVDKITKALSPNVIYQTTNYRMLTPVVGNRGRSNGIEPKRVQHYVDLIKSLMFFEDASILVINYAGKYIDGTNRGAAFEICKMPILFKLTADPRLNVTDNDILLDNMAIFNGTSPTWKAKQHVDSAIMSGSPLAIAFEDLRAKIVAKKNFGIASKDLTTNQLFTFVSKNKKALHGLKRNRVEYKNAELTKIAKSQAFYNDVLDICKVIRYFKVGSIRPSKVLERLMPLVWNGTVDINVFYSNLESKGFQFGAGEVVNFKSIEAKILKLSGVK
jgi:hypothetical protein